MTEVGVSFRGDGTFIIDLYYDVYAELAQVKPGQLTPAHLAVIEGMREQEREAQLNKLREMLLRRVRARFDGQPAALKIDFVPAPPRQVLKGSLGPPMPVIARLSGTIPTTAREFTFWASKSFGEVALRIGRENESEKFELIERGSKSQPFLLRSTTGDKPDESMSSRWASALKYLKLGFEHILPKGMDHILFVLGLFFLGNKLGPLLWQVSAFTVAHTITLALSTYGIAHLSPRIVEPLIALSIAYVAVENVWLSRKPRDGEARIDRAMPLHRPVIVFGFGLLHGMGFAGVLGELGLPRDQFLTALLSFNVGVELGQLSVIALAFVVVGWFRMRPWYNWRIAIPASTLIAMMGLFWFVERLLGA